MSEQPDPPSQTPWQSTSPPRRRGLALPLSIAAGVVVAVLVAVAIGGFVLFRPQLSGEHPASLSTPPQVAGLELSTEPVLEDAAAQMSAAMTAEAELDQVVAAFYTDPSAEDQLVMLAGGTAALRNPQGQLEAAFRGTSEGGLPVSDVAEIDPGPLGGIAQCGQGAAEGLPVAVCGWADHGSLVLVVFFNRSVDDGAALMWDIRAEILER